jgi:hypothetical protein
VQLPNDAVGGQIGIGHYQQWRSRFGNFRTIGGGPPVGAAVPESNILLLAVIGGCNAMELRRCRRAVLLAALLAVACLMPRGAAVAAPSCPGDYNDDGACTDAADYVVWRHHLGQYAPFYSLPNEGASFGIVDQADFSFWRARLGNFAGVGNGTAIGATGGAATPEPSGLLLTALGGSAWLLCRRHRQLHRSND